MTVIDLLADGAAKARQVKHTYRAPMSKAEYLSTLRSVTSEETYEE